MTLNLSRRQFVLYGSATFATSLLLKACNQTTTLPTASNDVEDLK